jgi:hypothetical protein
MLKAALRWVLVVASLMFIGPFAAKMLGSVRDVDGGHAVTLLVNGDMGRALLGGLLVFAAAAVVGLIGSHYLSLNTGMMSAGLVVAWGAWAEGATKGGTLENIVRRAGNGKDLPALAIEGFIVMLLAAGLTWAMVRVAHRAQQPAADATAATPVKSAPVLKAEAGAPALIYGKGEKPFRILLLSMLNAAAVCAVLAWLFAVSGDKGQTFAAALIGAIAAGTAAQTMAGSKEFHVTPVTPILAMALIALAGPLVAMVMHGGGIVGAVNAGTVFSLARPLSLDWAAGAVIGVPIGLGWAGSMLDRRHTQ